MPTKETLAVIAITGVVISTVLAVALHLLRQDLDPVSRYESEYAVGPYGLLMTAVFVARGAAGLALAWALYMGLVGDWRSVLGTVLLGLFGVGMWVLAVFPTDVRGALDTTVGAVHNWVALGAFVSVTAATLVLSSAFGSDPRWASFAPVSWVVAVLVLGSFLLFYVGPWVGVHGISGLTERVFIGLVMLWVLLVAIREL
jgi:hypothetical protein